MCGVPYFDGERRIGEAGPMQDHVLKYHVSQDQVPYYCRLCMYRCQTRGQMEHHVRHNAKHVAMATSRGVTNHEEWQVESPVPYRVGEKDLLKFSKEQSLLYYLQRQSPQTVQQPNATGVVDVQVPDDPLEILTAETLNQGFISIPEEISQDGAQLIPGQLSGRQHSILSPGTSSMAQQGTSPTVVLPQRSYQVSHAGQLRNIPPVVPRLPMMTPPAVYYPSPVASPLIVQEGSTSRIQMSNTVVTLGNAMKIGAELLSTVAPSSPVAGLARVVRRSPGVGEVATEVQSLQPLAQLQTTSPFGTVGTTGGSVVVVTEPTVTQPVTSVIVRDDSVSRVAQVNAVVTMDSAISMSAGQTGTITSVSPSPVVSVASTAEEPKVIGEIVAVVERPRPHLHQPMAPAVSTTCEANNSRILGAEPVVTQATSADTTTLVIAVETPSPTALQDVDASLWDEATLGHKSSPDEKGDSPLPPAAHTDDAEEGEIVENIMPQLMSTDDPEALSDAESSSGAEGSKSKATDKEDQSEEGSIGYHGTSVDERKAETEPEVKRRRKDAGEPVFEISMVAINGLTSVLQRLTSTMTTVEKRQVSTEKALIDVACALGKCQSALTQFKEVMEENGKEERRREERWLERERIREEERRKYMELEQRREVRRREEDRKEREEIKKLLGELRKERKEESKARQKDGDRLKGDKSKDNEEKEKEKENIKGLSSVLGKSYTFNTVKDYNKRK